MTAIENLGDVLAERSQTLDMRRQYIQQVTQAVAHDSTARQFAEAFTGHLDAAAKAATGAVVRRHRLAQDDTIAAEGRDRLAQEASEKGRADADHAIGQADVALGGLERHLRAAALPAAPDDRTEDHARQELPLLLASAPDPVRALVGIAAGSDQALAAVAVGRFGRALLASMGHEDDHEAVVAAALGAAGRSGDPKRRAAAEALATVRMQGAQARGVTAVGVGEMLGGP